MMSSRFSLKSITDSDTLIYVAPILIAVSLLHIFDANDITHKFGQFEVMGAIVIVCYYLWDKIPVVYEPAIMGKKRIEAVICMVVGLFSIFALMPPVLTWQYYNLYRMSDRFSLNRHIIVAVISLWVGVGVLFSSSYILTQQRFEASNSTLQESSMPQAPQ